jgi:hypothetical protein
MRRAGYIDKRSLPKGIITMNSGLKLKIGKLSHNVHIVLWAGLTGSVLFFAAYAIPRISAAQARIAATRLLEIAGENEALCTDLGLGAGTAAHKQCILAVQQFRAKVERRLSDDFDF